MLFWPGVSIFSETALAREIACSIAAVAEPGIIFRWMYPRNLWRVRRILAMVFSFSIVSSGVPITEELRKRPKTSRR